MKLTLAAAVLLLSAVASAHALEITKYDQLSLQDKARYMTMLLKGTEQILRNQGKHDDARRMGQLFNETPVGKQIPRE